MNMMPVDNEYYEHMDSHSSVHPHNHNHNHNGPTEALSAIPVPVSSIYFVFEGGMPIDEGILHPTKVVLAKETPTVSDLCETLKMIFFPAHHVFFSVSWNNNEYSENSRIGLPTDNRTAPVVVKYKYRVNTSKLHPITLKLIQWLENNDLDLPEVISVFTSNRISLTNMKYLKDRDLINMGIKEWGTRVNILEAVQAYHSTLSVSEQAKNPTNGVLKRKGPVSDSNPAAVKKLRTAVTQNSALKYKDIASLVSHRLAPVVLGSNVTVKGSSLVGEVVMGAKNKKVPTIEWTEGSRKKTGPIAHFFKAATGHSTFSAKGDDWSNIYFHHPSTGEQRYSLKEIKFLLEGPKKSISAFLYFSANIREQLGGKGGGGQFAKRSGEMWKKLPNEEKSKFQEKEEHDRDRYFKEKLEWQKRNNQLRTLMGVPHEEG